MVREVDVLIAGGGPVGAVLAASLESSGLDIALVDPGDPAAGRLRPIALSHGSRLVLEGVGAFAGLDATPIETIHVSQTGGFGRTAMRREELGIPALGYVVDLSALAAHLAPFASSVRKRGRIVRWEGGAERATATVATADGDETWSARLVILADGAGNAGAGLSQRDYGQAAIAATVRTEEAPRGIAWERFTPRGPLALLPFAQGYALVWTVAGGEAERMLAMDDGAFLGALADTFGGRLGRFLSAGPRTSYPLVLRFQREPFAAPRVMLAGNAAQTLHPVAGQGLNLGLRDAAELATLVRTTPRGEIGAPAFAARVAAARAADRYATIGLTDSLVRVFSNSNPALAIARGLGLVALDLAPPARRFFARRMIFGARALP
jgi:2-octaprenyl-6-methoxyphenol hydroxylase